MVLGELVSAKQLLVAVVHTHQQKVVVKVVHRQCDKNVHNSSSSAWIDEKEQ